MHRSRVRALLRRQGMTLIEIMIVVVIIGMITAAVGVGVVHVKKDSDLKLARTGLRNLANVAETYQVMHGSSSECPTLAQLSEGKLLRAGSSLDDPWGTPYELSCESGEVNVRSAGPDRDRGSPDDLVLLTPTSE